MVFYIDKNNNKKYTYFRKYVRRIQFMERKIEEFYRKWKSDVIRKPLVVYGARQIGKTYSVLEFGKKEYKNIHNRPCYNIIITPTKK